jgi:hypothetical protein
MNKLLFLTFSDGSYHHGEVHIYKPGNDGPSWTAKDCKEFLRCSDKCGFIRLTNGMLYNISSIVKVANMTVDEYIIFKRDTKLNKILL